MKNNTAPNQISSAEYLGYGLGSFSSQLANRTVSQYLLLYLTNCLLLDPVAAGSIFLIGRLVDAVSDLVMANIADRTRSRFGSYRPYLLFCSLPLAITFVLCFSVPGVIQGDQAKLIWVFVMYLLETSVFLTATGTSHGALATVMTRDPVARAKLASSRSVLETLATLLINALMMTVVLKFGGMSSPKGWSIASIIFASLLLAGYLICFATVKERYGAVQGGEKTPLRERVKTLKGNTPLLFLVLSAFVLMIGANYGGNAFSYYCIYNLNHPDWVAPMSVAGAVFGIGGAMAMPRLAQMVQKRHILLIGAGFYAASVMFLILIPGFWGALVYSIIIGLGNSMAMAAIWSLIPDASDYGFIRNQVASPGLIYSIITFVIKMVGGVSSYFVGLVLSLIGFDAALSVQPESALTGLRFSIIGVIFMAAVLCMLFSFGCRKLDHGEQKG